MPTFEEIINKILVKPGFWQKCLIGGILSFVPILNFFAFGYIYRFLQQLKARGNCELPRWERWDVLFVDGLRFFIIGVLFCAIPVGLVILLISLLEVITFGIINFVGYIVILVVLFVSPVLFACALYHYQKRERWESLLACRQWLPLLLRSAPRLCLPVIAFWGLCIMGAPLYGFAFYLGSVCLLSYCTIVFAVAEKQNKG